MAEELVFITGATGFVGFQVLIHTLQAGYRVRLSVRKESQIDHLREHALIAPFVTRPIEFVVIPDITLDGAFDDVLSGVIFVIHVASPLPQAVNDDPEKEIIVPAIKGTTSILHSALKVSTIRRFVVTSSAVAVIPTQALNEGDTTTLYSADSRINPLPSAPWQNTESAYNASKALALSATDRFLQDFKPHFSIVSVMPGYVIGRNELVIRAEDLIKGSNAIPLSIVLGKRMERARAGIVTDVRDVARIQVEALNGERVKASGNFVLDGENGVIWNDANEIAGKLFPGAVSSGVLPLGGSIPAVYQKIDGRKTVETFGKLTSYKEVVESVVGQYLELKGKEAGRKDG